ncbi:MAG: 50S ribosomal protein L12 [archaeon]
MEYIYAAMLIHKTGQAVSEENVKKVLEAAGVKVEDTKVKALVASLDGVDIDTVVKEAMFAPAASASSAEAKKEDKKEAEAEAAAGLGALFG